jgi:hypothetical protein
MSGQRPVKYLVTYINKDKIMENQKEDFEQEEFDEESPCSTCASSNYPDFMLEPDMEALQDGVRESSYLLGFVGGINSLGLSENSLMEIILSKINFGHQKELLRMQTASEERKSEIWSKSKANFIPMDDLD